MFDFHDINQNTDEWYSMRAGKITSSKLGVVMANYGKAFGEPAKKYARQIAVEQITGNPVSSKYKNEAMERGHREEPIARMMYESETFCDVSNGGFFSSPSIGCSPDGLIGNDGVIEIKSAEISIHHERIRKQKFDSGYKWQLIGNLKFTNRNWIDFISYCSEFPEGKKLYIYRLWSDEFENEMNMIDERVDSFLSLISESKETVMNSDYFNNMSPPC